VLEELHDGLTGEHFVGETIPHKILREGSFRDTQAYVSKCKVFQFSVGKEKR
jgi:hypothetical protein